MFRKMNVLVKLKMEINLKCIIGIANFWNCEAKFSVVHFGRMVKFLILLMIGINL